LVAQAFGSSGAHLNPAISLAAAVNTGDYTGLLSLWSAQILGAMTGSALMVLHFAPHWSQTPDPAAKLGIFCTGPAIKSPLANIASEIIGTMVLVIVAGS